MTVLVFVSNWELPRVVIHRSFSGVLQMCIPLPRFASANPNGIVESIRDCRAFGNTFEKQNGQSQGKLKMTISKATFSSLLFLYVAGKTETC